MFPSYYPVSNNGKYANNMFETQYTHTIKLLPLMLYVVTESMACGECQFKNTQSQKACNKVFSILGIKACLIKANSLFVNQALVADATQYNF